MTVVATSICHLLFLLFGFHLAVYLAQAELGEDIFQLLKTVFEVLQVKALAFLDEREDDIDLSSLLDLLADAFVERRHAVVIDMGGLDGLASWGQFVDDANIEIAVESHRQGAWNGRCRHHKHMRRVLALAPQLCTLGHAEAVLLVNHHHTEMGKLHGVLNDSMGSYENLHLARQQTVKNLLAFLAFDDARQQFHADVHVTQEVADSLQMLFGQYLRRRHDTCLIAVVQGNEHRHQGYERLTRTDIAL